MTTWIARFLQMMMMVSLLAMPSNVVSCPVAKASQPGMDCCGAACACPAEKLCHAVPTPVGERAVSLAQTVLSHRTAVLLYALTVERDTFSSSSVTRAVRNARPPPLIAGSPPQAKLRLWLL